MAVVYDLISLLVGICILAGSTLQAIDALGAYRVEVEGVTDKDRITIRGLRFAASVIFSWHGRWSQDGEWNYDPPDDATRYLRLAQGWILVLVGSGFALIVPLSDLYTRWNSWVIGWVTSYPWLNYGLVTAGVWLWLSIHMKKRAGPGRGALWITILRALAYAVIWPLWLIQVLISLANEKVEGKQS
jgi:hypothetical protein